jgi:hypothetical protein
MITVNRGLLLFFVLSSENVQAFNSPHTAVKSLRTTIIPVSSPRLQQSPPFPNYQPQSACCTCYLNPYRFNPRRRSPRPYRLQSSLISVESCVAAFTILFSSLLGLMSEWRKLFGGNLGTVITLISAALMTNFGIFGLEVPTNHQIYDICWTRLLPSSLALFLMSHSDSLDEPMPHRPTSKGRDKNSSSHSDIRHIHRQYLTIIACGIPFIIGSIGSVIGCFCSALIMTRFCSFMPSLFRMQPFEAAVAAGK